MTGAIWLISKVKRGTAFAAVFGWSAVVVLARVALPQRLPDASQKLAMHTADGPSHRRRDCRAQHCLLAKRKLCAGTGSE